jgi:hypothetical protein
MVLLSIILTIIDSISIFVRKDLEDMIIPNLKFLCAKYNIPSNYINNSNLKYKIKLCYNNQN